MNNSNIPFHYKGRYLERISDAHNEDIHVEYGTVLIQEVEGSITYFELSADYTFYKKESSIRPFIPMELGSVVDNIGNPLDDSKRYALPKFVRFPSEKELKWYEKLSLI